jgi:hypothetical protein
LALAASLEVADHETLALTAHQQPVVHTKAKGGGYEEGSPMYDKQEDLREKGQLVQYGGASIPSGEGPPVSTTMKCIIDFACQYFLVYTALAIVRTYIELAGTHSGPVAATLVAATSTVNFAPMLSVLFLGTRLRALQLSGGDPDKHHLPQDYVQNAMWCCAWSLKLMTLMVLLLPVVMGTTPAVGADGMPEIKANSPGIMGKVLVTLRWIFMIMLYGGFTTVCIGAFSMEAPTSVYPDGAPPVSPAVGCTMNLAMQFFFVYLAIAVVQTYEQIIGKTEESQKLGGVLQLATNTVNFAPMLSILFIGARMRALQIDPVNGNPQAWAQMCFRICAYSVLLQLILVLAVPYALGGTCVRGSSEGDITFEVPNASLFWILSMFRYALMLALYGGFTAVIVSVFTIDACTMRNEEDCGITTPPVSPAMICVMNLTVQYFFVYLMLWVLITVKQLSLGWNTLRYDSFFASAIATMEAAKNTVMFCPMLAVLFIGLRMRALQISDQQGNPQKFAQQGMYLSTYAVMLQVFMVLLMPLFLGGPPKVDDDGNVVSKPSSPIVGYILVTVRYLALICLYGGVVAIIYGLFTITPETAMLSRKDSPGLIPGFDVDPPPTITTAAPA